MYAEHIGKQAADAVRNGEKYRVIPWAKLAPSTQGQWRSQAEAEVMANRRPGPNRGVRRGDPGVIGQRILADGRTVVTDYGGGHTETYRWPYPMTMASLGWSASRSTGPTMAGPFASVAELRQELAEAHDRERDAYHRGVTDADARANRQAGQLTALRRELEDAREGERMAKCGRESMRHELEDAREHLRDARERIGKLSNELATAAAAVRAATDAGAFETDRLRRENDDLRRGIMRGQNVVTMEAHRYALAFAERERDDARRQRAEAIAQRDKAVERVERLREKLAEAERGWEAAGGENRASREQLRRLRAELAETRDIAADAQREREEARDKHVECYRQLTHTRELLAEAVATASRPLPACKGHNDAEYKRGLTDARGAVMQVQARAVTDNGEYAQGRAMGLRLVLNRLDLLEGKNE
jgi:hypothetical protein